MHILVFDITCIFVYKRTILTKEISYHYLMSRLPWIHSHHYSQFNTRGTALVFTLSGTPGKNFNVFIKIILLRNVDLHSILKSGP